MKTRLVKIGNSRGVRIPKFLLDQVNLGEEVELALQKDQIIVRPAHRPRRGWEEAFREMAERGDDALLDGDVVPATTWDEEEWEW
ncbi:MAG: AbrB/MazE/SpoVT family DNA-binding domain-containing protein [Caldilineae bacterium]|nr:MAG: AbrB/MazE/SpoVT family DNA-binding domain-containing protein [Caldilineae bacterium]